MARSTQAAQRRRIHGRSRPVRQTPTNPLPRRSHPYTDRSPGSTAEGTGAGRRRLRSPLWRPGPCGRAGCPVARQAMRSIVERENDDVARREGGSQKRLGIGGEGVAVPLAGRRMRAFPVRHGSIDDHGRGETAEAQARDQRGRLPVPMRDRGAAALAARAAPAQAGHLCGGPARHCPRTNGGQRLAVDEDEPQGIEFGLELEPGLAPRGHVLARLLAGMRRLFLYVMRSPMSLGPLAFHWLTGGRSRGSC